MLCPSCLCGAALFAACAALQERRAVGLPGIQDGGAACCQYLDELEPFEENECNPQLVDGCLAGRYTACMHDTWLAGWWVEQSTMRHLVQPVFHCRHPERR